MRIELHDPELNVVVHEEITTEPSAYKFKKGDRVRNIEPDDQNIFHKYYEFGISGTVQQDSEGCPFVEWDNGECLPQTEKWLQLITEPEIKPVQFDTERDTYVECTPEQRAEILRVAQEYGRAVFQGTDTDEKWWPNICWDKHEKVICGLRKLDDTKEDNCIPFPEFLARLKGEWNPIEVTEAHSSLVLDDLQHRVSGEALEMAQPDYSRLIGKWVRYCLNGLEDKPFFGKWAQIKQVEDMGGSIEIWINELDVFGDLHHGSFTNDLHGTCFDLSNPRDTNPDEQIETRIPFSIERYDSGDFLRYETRDGREVKCVVLNDVENDFPVTGYLVGEKGPFCFNTNGNSGDGFERISDLFMVVIKGGEE